MPARKNNIQRVLAARRQSAPKPKKRTAEEEEAVPKAVRDLLAKVQAEEAVKQAAKEAVELGAEAGPSRKRRRIDHDSTTSTIAGTTAIPPLKKQTTYEDFSAEDDLDDDSDASDDEDIEFEDVLPLNSSDARTLRPAAVGGDLDLVLGEDDDDEIGAGGLSRRLKNGRRKVLTAADRKMRLAVHKLHVLALVAHVRIRSAWCDEAKVQVCSHHL